MTLDLPQRMSEDLARAFPEFVDTHGPMILTLATRLTDPSTGEDIAQETFLRAYRALSGYDTQRIESLDLRPWLVTIARNLVRNEYRRQHRRPTMLTERAPEPGGDGAAMDPAAMVDAADTGDAIDLLAGLTDPQREAVVLYHVIGLPMREVALTMACPEGTARSHVSRGLARLRERNAPATTEEAR